MCYVLCLYYFVWFFNKKSIKFKIDFKIGMRANNDIYIGSWNSKIVELTKFIFIERP